MSILTVQIGQCGNQIGPVFFNTLASEYCSNSGTFYEQMPWNPFFRLHEDGSVIARSVLIDMEPSVVEAAFSASQSTQSQWSYLRGSCVKSDGGSGNNWAMGYLQHGPRFRNQILNSIRQELEQTDYFGGFLMIHSIAGGTGSGLGAYLTRTLMDEFSTSFLLNYCIWPFEAGEVIVQNYNALLTLNELLDSSHGVLMMENDVLANLSQSQFRFKRPSFTHMNTVAMESLASCLLPSKVRSMEGQESVRGWSPGNWTRIISDLLLTLCPNPKQKLMKCTIQPQINETNAKYSVLKWSTLLEQITTPLSRSKAKLKNFKDKSIANYLFLRGRDSLSCDVQSFRNGTVYWNSVERLGVSYSPGTFRDLSHSISLISNRQSNVLPVLDALEQAKQMLNTNAFLHNYESYGLTKSDFQNACSVIENDLVENYFD